MNKAHTAWKMFVFGVFLVRIFPHWDWIRTIKNPKTETFHVVSLKSTIMQITHQAEFLPSAASKACTSFHYSTKFLKTNVSRKSRLYFPFNVLNKPNLKHYHCVKCVQIRVFFLVCIFPDTNWILRISPYWVRMRENKDQKNSVFGHFSRSVYHMKIWQVLTLLLLMPRKCGKYYS